jgi:hypothetical protein
VKDPSAASDAFCQRPFAVVVVGRRRALRPLSFCWRRILPGGVAAVSKPVHSPLRQVVVKGVVERFLEAPRRGRGGGMERPARQAFRRPAILILRRVERVVV